MEPEDLFELSRDENGNNFGAVKVIALIISSYPQNQSDKILRYLLDNNIRGGRLYEKFKYEYKENIYSFVDSLNYDRSNIFKNIFKILKDRT